MVSRRQSICRCAFAVLLTMLCRPIDCVQSEWQADYIADIVTRMQREGEQTIDVTEKAEADWAEMCRTANAGKVWDTTKNW